VSRREQPPRPLAWLARQLVPRLADDATLGDLDERYAHRLRTARRGAASRWYARQLLGFAIGLPAASARGALARGPGIVSGTMADVRHEAKALVRQRGFALGVVFVLALAVGAAATAFSLLHGVLLQPLPFAAPDELVMLWDEYPPGEGGREPKPVTELQYRAWRERTGQFAATGAFESIPAVIRAGDWPEQIDAALVTASLFPALGVRPALGRLFTDDDDVRGAARVVILSHELWQSRFGGDAGVLGRSIPIDGEPTTVVGVMPAGFWFYDPYAVTRSYAGAGASAAQLWRPLAGRFADEPDYPRYRVVARLRPDATAETAAAAIGAAERSLSASLPEADGRVRVVPLADQILAPVRPQLLGLAAAVALVLIVAAVNLVSLFAARLEARRADAAVRAALGASRRRLVRGAMIQGALVGLAGGAAGALLAAIVLPALVALVPRGLPLAHRVGVDPIVAGFALAVAVAVGVAVAALSAWRAGHDGSASLPASRSRGVAGSAARRRWRSRHAHR
jgi:putative ABC transport system permease protein